MTCIKKTPGSGASKLSRLLSTVLISIGDNRWYEKAGLRRDALSSQVIDALKAQEIKETGSEED
jgi:hypothetical protein